jgi:hypothetical protein
MSTSNSITVYSMINIITTIITTTTTTNIFTMIT